MAARRGAAGSQRDEWLLPLSAYIYNDTHVDAGRSAEAWLWPGSVAVGSTASDC